MKPKNPTIPEIDLKRPWAIKQKIIILHSLVNVLTGSLVF